MWDVTSITELLGSNGYKIVWTVLWIALSLVTLTLLTFMRAKPLSKCVFLSLFAHILLIGHAYMTHLALPPGPIGEVMQVTLRDDPLDDPADAQPREIPPWDQHVPQDTIVPEHVKLARERILSSDPPLKREGGLTPQLTLGVPTEAAVGEVVEVPGDQPQPVKSIHQATTGAQAAEIEVPRAERRAEATPTGPPVEDLARPRPRIGAAAPPHRNPRNESPRDLITPTPNLQELIDASRAALADAAASRRDLTSATQNQTLPGAAVPHAPAVAAGQDLPDPLARVDQSPGGAGEGATRGGAEGDRPHASAAEDAAHHSDTPGPTKTAAPRRRLDGSPLPAVYRLRMQVDRGAAARKYGGNERTEAAVAAALKWLAENQNADGSWSAAAHGAGSEARTFRDPRTGRDEQQRPGSRADTGVTALALLAFMGAGNTHQQGQYRENVRLGLNYLLRKQDRSDGNLGGDATYYARMYCHGIGTFALAEAYALTGEPTLKSPVQSAATYTLRAQSRTDGGWRYLPGQDGDMSQFGWQVMSLDALTHGGFDLPEQTREGMRRFLARCSWKQDPSQAPYRPGENPKAAMTAEALLCRLILGAKSSDPNVAGAADALDRNRPGRDEVNFYYWYYGTLALRQLGGPRWERWNEALQIQLLRRQRKDRRMTGSWDPAGSAFGAYGGRVYTTAMGALCLEAYYRFAAERGE